MYDDESTDKTNSILNFYKNLVNIDTYIIDSSKYQHFKDPFKFDDYDYILNIDIDEFLYISHNLRSKYNNLENYLADKKSNNYSVIEIPSFDCGDKTNFHSDSMHLGLETLKYNFMIDRVTENKTDFKHFFDPNNSCHNDGHTSTPINNTKIFHIYNSYNVSKETITKGILVSEIINNLYLFIFHFRNRNIHAYNKNNTKYRITKATVNVYRYNLECVDPFLKKLNYKSNMHIKFSEKLFCNFYNKFGFFIVRNLFEKRQIDKIVNQAKDIYKIQMKKLNIITSCDIDNNTFEEKIKILFENHFNTFLNCGKQCQHIIDLWKLSVDDKILDIIKILGIQDPIVSTQPVLFSNSKHISKSDMNHTIPPHQDWASMQGSVNSIVCWVPLIDINQDLGSVSLIPETHKLGLLTSEKKDIFGLVNDFNNDDFKSTDVKQGDVIFFSSFLVHSSGNNITNNIRWSTHFRYNDLNDKSFINNGYPHPYTYKPVDDILLPDFDTKEATKTYFENI